MEREATPVSFSFMGSGGDTFSSLALPLSSLALAFSLDPHLLMVLAALPDHTRAHGGIRKKVHLTRHISGCPNTHNVGSSATAPAMGRAATIAF